jgi:nitroreductase
MTIAEAIKTRRTVKWFKPQPICDSDLRSWLEAASFAPNHRMNEPWEILAIGPETRARLAHKTDFGGAPVVIAVLSKPAPGAMERDENMMAAACFVQNLLLAAHAQGVGVYWSSMGAIPRNRDILGVPQGYDVVGVLGIGYPAEVPPAKSRTPIEAKITYLA